MITLEISKSKYIEWLKEQLEDVETLDEMDEIGYHVPDFAITKGFDEAQEFLMEANKDNLVYFTFFVKEIIDINSYGADQIDIKWVD